MNNIRIFEHGMNVELFRTSAPALYIQGVLPAATPRLEYEGRLQVVNAVGTFTVEQVAGDPLPLGGSITADNTTKEIVVGFPAFSEEDAILTNPGFESGYTGWELGSGWSVDSDNPIDGSRDACYVDHRGESFIKTTTVYPAVPGSIITANCKVRQGASSAGNAGAAVSVFIRGLSGEETEYRGNAVMSASNGAVYPSSATSVVVPANATGVRLGAVGIRKRQNRKLNVDSFSWNYKVASQGAASERTISLTLKVTDSKGRVAYWSGTLLVTWWDGSYLSLPRTGSLSATRGTPIIFLYSGVVRIVTGGHDGLVLWSDDLGTTWSESSSPINNTAYYHHGFAFNVPDAVLVSCGHYIARSLDGGQSWNRVYTPYNSAWKAAIFVESWDKFVVVGGDSYTARIVTLDAMATTYTVEGSTGDFYAVVYIPTYDRVLCLPHSSSSTVLGMNTSQTGWSYPTAPAMLSKRGVAVLPSGEIWVSTNTGYMKSVDGGETWSVPFAPNTLSGVDTFYNTAGSVGYDPDADLLMITPYGSGAGSSSRRTYVSRDRGATFEATSVAATSANTATPEGLYWSESARCFYGSDNDLSSSDAYLFFSNSGALI